MPELSIVAPVYNEAEITLKALVDGVDKAISQIGVDYEIILIDDGSPVTETWETICALNRANSGVRGVQLARNFGQHPAIAAGLDHATGNWVVVMDSDLQDRPEIIPKLYRKAKEGYEVVFVDRQKRPETAFYKLGAFFFYKILNLLAGHGYERRQANFSILSQNVVEAFRQVPDRDRFYGGTVRWLGFRETSIPASHGERFFGRPTYNLKKRFRFAFQLILGYSTRLLYLAIIVGLLMACLAFAMALEIVIYTISNPHLPVPGWPSVITAVFFTAGVTNIMLGLIGLYIGDLTERTRGRPPYVVRSRTGQESSERKRSSHRVQADGAGAGDTPGSSS